MKVAIDAGHGMGNRSPGVYDPGAVAGGKTEAAIALQFAKSIQFILDMNGIETFLTRTDAKTPCPVGSRNEKAEAAGCTHFISIHLNAGGGTGTETLYRDDRVFAKAINDAVVESLELPNRGIKHESVTRHGRLAVLDFKGQACLVELGFIDSAKDRKLLCTREARVAVSEAILGVLKQLGSK